MMQDSTVKLDAGKKTLTKRQAQRRRKMNIKTTCERYLMARIPQIAQSLDELRSAHVEPMALEISAQGFQWYKYKALPGHPHPGKAGDGWSHPSEPLPSAGLGYGDFTAPPVPGAVRAGFQGLTDQQAYDLSERIKSALGIPTHPSDSCYCCRADGHPELKYFTIARASVGQGKAGAREQERASDYMDWLRKELPEIFMDSWTLG
jgi:hypothetical protein